MSVVRATDLLTLPIRDEKVKEEEYLSDVSPRHKPWDKHRGEADDVRAVFEESREARHQRYAERVEFCSRVLEFARDPPTNGKRKMKLEDTWFCRVRFCPVCQWRRSLCWQAKVYRALPRLIADYPDVRFLFLTLTIKNCAVCDLRRTLGVMRLAWVRLMQLQAWPAIGWVRSVEITRSKDGTAHPHYHCLLVVPPSYFQGDYLKQKDWAELWRQSLRINYRPVVDIRIVKPEQRLLSGRKIPAPWNIWGAVVEILKYAVKPSDMVRDPEWFLALVDQVHKTRAVAIGGILKKYIRDRKKEDLTSEPGEEELEKEIERVFFGWKQNVRKYRKIGVVSSAGASNPPVYLKQ
jgi:plasmid rolling circle replication initiator protein Rep